VGTTWRLPALPFGQVQLRYSKIEPYTYTHPRDIVPWYGSNAMETAYISGGAPLGYYLPPNSDEVLLKVELAPALTTRLYGQYQMIRHGAEHGTGAVDGSSWLSELSPDDRSTDPRLRKYFLKDGAYQWSHVLKVGGEHTLGKGRTMPVHLFGDIGVVYSYYTNIDGDPNTGTPGDYSVVDTPEYPKVITPVATIGLRFFAD
jgi:hypothetical protein